MASNFGRPRPLLAGLALALTAATRAAVFNIADFGAKPDDATPATDAFRRAMAAARHAGGGTIEAPTGHFVSGPIELFGHLTPQVDPGAVVRDSDPMQVGGVTPNGAAPDDSAR